MICKICGKEFGNGAYCQNCNTDRIKALGNYSGFNVNSNDMISKQSVDKTSDNVTGMEYDNEHYQNNAICDFCGEVIPAYSLFCPACGKKRQVECPCCHKIFSAKWKFCPYCGANVETYSEGSKKEKKEQSKEREERENYDCNEFIFDKKKYRGQEIITIPQSVKHIHRASFRGCNWITQIILPDTLENISSDCFRNCSNLRSIVVPGSVKVISPSAFYGCTSLEKFDGKYSSDDGCSLVKDGELIAIAPAGIGESYAIPDTVTKVSADFGLCDNLKVIRIPDSVIEIDEYDFFGCSPSAYFISNKFCPLGERFLIDGNVLLSVALNGVDTITIPNTIEVIGTRAFRGCKTLKHITIPKSVTKIGWGAFRICIYNHRTTKTNQKYPSVNL